MVALLMQLAGDQVDDVWPGRTWIARQLGWSTRTVDRRLAELRRVGVLEWAHRAVSDQGRVRTLTNLYRLCVPEGLAEGWRKARERTAAVRAQKARQRSGERPRRAPEGASGGAPGVEPRRSRGEVDDARSLVAGLYRSGSEAGDIEAEVKTVFADRPTVLAAALAELQRIRAGP